MKRIEIKGMSCGHCVQSVTKALSAVEGLHNVTVDLPSGTAVFEESGPVDPEAVRAAISKIGFEPGDIT